MAGEFKYDVFLSHRVRISKSQEAKWNRHEGSGYNSCNRLVYPRVLGPCILKSGDPSCHSLVKDESLSGTKGTSKALLPLIIEKN